MPLPIVRPTQDGQFWLDTRALQQRIFGGGEVPETDAWYRKYFGRSLTPSTIETVLRQAEAGYMRDLTDLESEIIGIDGHLFSTAQKRFPLIASVDYDIKPASGPGLDPQKAKDCAELVQHGFAAIPNLRQAIVDLNWGHYHGRSSIEKQWVYKPSSPLKWSITELNWIHPRRLSFGPERELRLVDSMFQTGYFAPVGFDLRSIPFKWIQFTPRLRNEYPEREGIAPICLYWAYFKRFSTRERLILMEVFGKPWRIVEVDQDAAQRVQKEQLDRAKETADKLGANASAAMPAGVHLRVEQPADGAGEVHSDVVQQANDEMSKAIVGQTRTTEAKPNAIGSSGDETAQQEQDAIVNADGWRLSPVLTEQLARDLVVLNRGPEWAIYTPTVLLRTQRPIPRSTRIENTTKTLSLGIPLKLDDVYNETGYERPGDNDATVQMVSAGTRDVLGNVTGETKTVIIDPSKASAPLSKLSNLIDLVDRIRMVASHRSHDVDLVCRAKQPQSENGSPEPLIDRGVMETARETGRWAREVADAVDGLDAAGAIFERLNRVALQLPLTGFARAIERRMLHSLMLGALDSLWERETDEVVPIESFAATRSMVITMAAQLELPFAEMPFDAAVRLFRTRNVLRRDIFEQLSGAAKRRAFTIAKLARQDLLADAHSELTKQIERGANAMVTAEGPNLGDFSKFCEQRLESAGWTPANPSHVETIYRTNVMSAYGDGRKAEMLQPEVLAARPIWQARGVDDDRSRPAHKAAHGRCFVANDPAWPPTPWGYNCRCRIISRSQRWFEAGAKALEGPPLGIPDDGFDAGSGSLLGLMAAE